MTREEAEALLPLLVVEELPAHQLPELEAWLTRDEALRQELEDMARAFALVGSAVVEEILETPEAVVEPAPRPKPFRFRWVHWAAACFLIAILWGYLYTGMSSADRAARGDHMRLAQLNTYSESIVVDMAADKPVSGPAVLPMIDGLESVADSDDHGLVDGPEVFSDDVSAAESLDLAADGYALEAWASSERVDGRRAIAEGEARHGQRAMDQSKERVTEELVAIAEPIEVEESLARPRKLAAPRPKVPAPPPISAPRAAPAPSIVSKPARKADSSGVQLDFGFDNAEGEFLADAADDAFGDAAEPIETDPVAAADEFRLYFKAPQAPVNRSVSELFAHEEFPSNQAVGGRRPAAFQLGDIDQDGLPEWGEKSAEPAEVDRISQTEGSATRERERRLQPAGVEGTGRSERVAMLQPAIGLPQLESASPILPSSAMADEDERQAVRGLAAKDVLAPKPVAEAVAPVGGTTSVASADQPLLVVSDITLRYEHDGTTMSGDANGSTATHNFYAWDQSEQALAARQQSPTLGRTILAHSEAKKRKAGSEENESPGIEASHEALKQVGSLIAVQQSREDASAKRQTQQTAEPVAEHDWRGEAESTPEALTKLRDVELQQAERHESWEEAIVHRAEQPSREAGASSPARLADVRWKGNALVAPLSPEAELETLAAQDVAAAPQALAEPNPLQVQAELAALTTPQAVQPPQERVELVPAVDPAAMQAKLEAMLAPQPVALEADDAPLPPAPAKPAPPVNPFVMTKHDKQSTFALEADTASYTQTRRYISRGYRPPQAIVRMEEFVNAFDYGYPEQKNATFVVHAKAGAAPFGKKLTLLKLGVRGKVLGRDQQKAAHLVFVVDASGSMAREDRLPLVQQSLRLLVDQLDDEDRVSLVAYNERGRLLLDAEPAANKTRILEQLAAIECGYTTNLLAGVEMGYTLAARHFKAGQVNRIVLCSDGVANVGPAEAESILAIVEKYRQQGVTFTSVGVGSGAYDDSMMEQLANKGDGNYVFLDSLYEAQRVFVDNFAATLHHIAKDVKIQVEFNPDAVRRYRLIGYENRDIADKDFRNDAVDAGEIGSGQTATALYELELRPGDKSPLGTVYVRYKDPDGAMVSEFSQPLKRELVQQRSPQTDPRFYLAACVAEFAEILRGSEHARGSKLAKLEQTLIPVAAALPLDQKVQELLLLVQKAQGLPQWK